MWSSPPTRPFAGRHATCVLEGAGDARAARRVDVAFTGRRAWRTTILLWPASWRKPSHLLRLRFSAQHFHLRRALMAPPEDCSQAELRPATGAGRRAAALAMMSTLPARLRAGAARPSRPQSAHANWRNAAAAGNAAASAARSRPSATSCRKAAESPQGSGRVPTGGKHQALVAAPASEPARRTPRSALADAHSSTPSSKRARTGLRGRRLGSPWRRVDANSRLNAGATGVLQRARDWRRTRTSTTGGFPFGSSPANEQRSYTANVIRNPTGGAGPRARCASHRDAAGCVNCLADGDRATHDRRVSTMPGRTLGFCHSQATISLPKKRGAAPAPPTPAWHQAETHTSVQRPTPSPARRSTSSCQPLRRDRLTPARRRAGRALPSHRSVINLRTMGSIRRLGATPA